MRSHVRASSFGSSAVGSAARLRFTFLAAIAAAFFLVPAAQAFAAETLKVEIEGQGAVAAASPGFYEGSPPLSCHIPSQLGDVCEPQMSNESEGYEGVSMKATPAPGWEFVEWVTVEGSSENCESAEGCLAYSEPPGSGGATVKAVFALEPVTHETLKVEIEGHGEVISGGFGGFYAGTPPISCHGPSQLGDVCENEMSDEGEGYEGVSLSAIPAAGWEFDEWVTLEGSSEGCESEEGCLAYSEPPGSGGATVKAVFAPIAGNHQLDIDIVGQGEVKCSAEGGAEEPCKAEYPDGTHIALIPQPAQHFQFGEFDNATGSAEGTCEGTQTCEFTLEADTEVDASFERITHTLGVTLAGTGSGTAECKIGSGTFGSCSGAIDEGEAVTVKGTAALHSTFKGWSNGTGSALSCSGTSECSFNLEADSTLTATFDQNTHTLAITTSGNGVGSVTCKEGAGTFGSCSLAFNEGAQITVKATEAPHSAFEGFSGGTNSAATCSGKASHECAFVLEADSALTIGFAKVKRSLSVSITGTGQGEVKCKVASGPEEACLTSYNEHTEITLVAHPGAQSSFAGFSGTGSASKCASASSCTFFLEADSSATAQMDAVKQPDSGNGGGAGQSSSPLPPPAPQCLVPKLKGLSLSKAKQALAKASCAAGKVTKPKAKKGQKQGPLVVKSSKPGSGASLPAGSKVDLTLAPKAKSKKGGK